MPKVLRNALLLLALLMMSPLGAQALRPDISVTPQRQLVFEWNAPPTIPTLRKLRPPVYLDFAPAEGNRTTLTLRNFGYGEGDERAKTKAYFEKARPALMACLEKRFATT